MHTPTNELARQVMIEIEKIQNHRSDDLPNSVEQLAEWQGERLAMLVQLRQRMFSLSFDPKAEARYQIYANKFATKMGADDEVNLQ